MKLHPTLRTLLLSIILICLIATVVIYLGLTQTKVYEQVSRHDEVFVLPEHPYSLADAIQQGKAFTMEYPEDGTFTILWGTDFHLRRGPFSGRKKIYSLLEKAFNECDPDLTIITGDLLFSFNALSMLKEFATFMEEHQRPWALVWGNHDGEYRHDRVQLGDALTSYPHALFSRGEEWVLGESDYTIALTNQGEVVQALMFLDSHDHRVYEHGKGPDYIYPSQIAWYSWVAQALEAVPLYTFFHIPLPEYREMWESGQGTGVKGDRKINTAWENSGLFDTMLEHGNTIATFSGHDHLNDYAGEWKGITLHSGRSASYGSYSSPWHAKGIKTITLDTNNPTNFTVTTYTVDDWGI